MSKNQLLSIVVPCYNEASNIRPFYMSVHKSLLSLAKLDYELIFINDGSKDSTLHELHTVAKDDPKVKLISLSRNFGKEVATTAGIHFATGDAIIIIDADGQHPASLIPDFVKKWEAGADVVVGLRKSNVKEGMVKRQGSKLFYALFNKFSGGQIAPGSTDFRLIDKAVQKEFTKLTERNRITRGLIDWLGFEHAYIEFDANERMSGEATYSFRKLVKLAFNSFVSLSLEPLYLSIYAGLVIVPLSTLVGIVSAVEMLMGDPMHLNITGSGFMVVLVLFLVGILLISQGIMALYLSHIHTETQNRPLFVVDKKDSRGINLEEI